MKNCCSEKRTRDRRVGAWRPFETDLKLIYLRHLSVIGSTMGSPAEFKHVLGLLAAGSIHPVIDRIYPLAEAGEAQRRLEARGQFGKILLQVMDPAG
jgi:NADPH:quinone reductase-like Zn-dependent oxidoreductase